MTTTVVPVLPLAVSSPRLPRTAAERLAMYSPRDVAIYSPRTHRERLTLTGSELEDALEAAAELAEKITRLSARGEAARSSFIAKAQANSDANSSEMCPICMEQLSAPLACSNQHKFCGECLRSYRRSCPNSPRLACPLCRVSMPHYPLKPWQDGTDPEPSRSPPSPLHFGMR